jgi:hypothetical protein
LCQGKQQLGEYTAQQGTHTSVTTAALHSIETEIKTESSAAQKNDIRNRHVK